MAELHDKAQKLREEAAEIDARAAVVDDRVAFLERVPELAQQTVEQAAVMMEAFTGVSRAILRIMQAMSAPRELVRDEKGKAIGVRIV